MSAKLRTWQASLASAGGAAFGGGLPEPLAAIARFAASPAGAFSGLLACAKMAGDARAEMYRMSQATGVGVEKLSALGYAARRAGIDNATLAAGLKKLQSKEFAMALQGMAGKHANPLKGDLLGLGRGGDAADQLRAFMKATENMSAGDRAGLAKKYGISELLPLLALGIDQLDAFTAHAKELGLVMTEEDARAGKDFGIAMGDLHDVLKSSISAIGGALVPLITGLTKTFVQVVVGIRDWIKEHRGLTTMIFYGTGAIVAGGLALKGFAFVIGTVQKAVAGLQFAFKALKAGVGLVIDAVSSIGILANPWVLAGLAVAGLVAWVAKLTGAMDGIGDLFKGIAADFSQSLGAVTNALSRGDIQSDWGVVVSFLKMEWVRTTNYLSEAWQNLSNFVLDWMEQFMPVWSVQIKAMSNVWNWFVDNWKEISTGISGAWSVICNSLKTAFSSTIAFVRKEWQAFLDLVAQATANSENAAVRKEHAKAEMLAKRFLTPEQIAAADKDKEQHRAWNYAHATPDVDPATLREQVEKDIAAEAAHKHDQAKWNNALYGEIALGRARIALKEAIDKANGPGKNIIGKDNQAAENAFSAASAAEVRGTFSGSAAAMLGGGGDAIAQKVLDVQQDMLMIHRAQLDALDEVKDKLEAINQINVIC